MDIKFLVVSKDESFKMDESRFNAAGLAHTVSVEYVKNNTEPLSKVYNRKLADVRSAGGCDALVLMHGDVSFNLLNFVNHLEQVHTRYDLIGLCGTAIFNVSQSPLNWWTGSNPTPNAKWGCVTHGELGDQTSYFSQHSPMTMDAEVACIDGLCIIFTKKALETDMAFDEGLSSFDFYDSDISMQALVKYKLKIGVMVQKDLCHYSVGRSILTPEFLDGEELFRKKWNLPFPEGSAIVKHLAMKAQFHLK